MLVQNPVTEYIYIHGYNGIENMHDYCERYAGEIIEMYLHEHRNDRDVKIHIDAFKNKVRWASNYGIFLRFELEKHIRITNVVGGFDLNSVKSRRGKRYIGFSEFAETYPGVKQLNQLMDLRGISILERVWQRMTVENVDFTDAAFNDCDFYDVTFRNCIFTNTSFVNVKLEECHFESSCVFWKNDFKGATLNSQFDCEIIRPRIVEMGRKEALIKSLGLEGEYHAYTKFGHMNRWRIAAQNNIM